MPLVDIAKQRLLQTFRFLKELNELRNPVARDLSSSEVLHIEDWPSHPSISVLYGDRADEVPVDIEEADPDPLIRVVRAKLTPCPSPPSSLEEWLSPSWRQANEKVVVLESRNVRTAAGGTVTARFSEDSQRVSALRAWTTIRDRWAEAERPSLAARQVFERIHELWAMLQRESERVELLLADGVLSVPEHSIRHPILLQRVTLEFDPAIPEFRFFPDADHLELHRALLRLVPSLEGRTIAQLDKELLEHPVEPLGGASTTGFFKRLVQDLFPAKGEFLEDIDLGTNPSGPSVWRSPTLLVRPRTAGLGTALNHILEDLADEESQPPQGLARIVGVETAEVVVKGLSEDEPAPQTPSGPDPDVLFSKPANAEQYEIATRLNRAKSVLVQGPPGTGKTYTIGNLLGLLLSQGKTVLVTAHTTKALKVLRGQVDEALQPLCLSVLEGDTESQAQLSRAAQAIADRLSRSDAASLRREAASLRGKRRELLAKQDQLQRQLRDARFSEVEEVVFNGEGLNPLEVARRVHLHAERDGWIPGPLEHSSLCPLTASEIVELYRAQGVITDDDDRQLAVAQPTESKLVAPSDFKALAEEHSSAQSRAREHRPEMWGAGGFTSCTAAQLQDLHRRVQQAAATLSEKEAWLREIMFAGWMDGEHKGAWTDLLAVIDSLVGESGTAHRLMMAHGPVLPSGRPLDEVATTLGEIISHLEAGRSLGFKTKITRRGWHQLIEACRVDGHEPRMLDEFRALRAAAKLARSRKRFAARWRRAVEAKSGPTVESLGPEPERAAQPYTEQIRRRLEWRTTVWEPLISELRSSGFIWEAWLAENPPIPGDVSELARVERAGSIGLVVVVEAQAARIRQSELSAALITQRTYLAGFPQSDAASVLLLAQEAWDTEQYAEACREIARLEGLREDYARRVGLLHSLKAPAPAWFLAISERQKPHDASLPPGEAKEAWRWRQWLQELEKRAAVSIPDLQGQLDRTEKELLQSAAQIIDLETWAAQRERTGLAEQQALMGFVQTIRKVGKRTGKRVPELLREARRLLATARRAVPVWIMPLNRVYESFDAREKKFDVVIIDEASQSDVTALAALYLGREHVVVGDKEQVTPDAVGQRVDEVTRLISTDLQGVPNSHLYDGQTSIYDLAETAFGGTIALREHFRCMPEIIAFSNNLSYGNTIRPLREPLSANIRPALVAHRVLGHRDDGGKTNQVEAEEVASLVVACLKNPDYAYNESGQPTSIGVISLLGDEQALLIDDLLRRELSPDSFVTHRVLCGNAAQFQGDERDVVFLSMVDGPPEDGPHNLRDAGPRDLYKKRYNVAASRARNQLWVVHSLDPDIHLKPGDLRRRLIEHARDPKALLRSMENLSQSTESVFEAQVLRELLAAGFRVRPQWTVGAYRIDMVVEGTRKRLAVECDGERWHTPDQLHRDLQRQAILERLGWNFVRIRGSVFFRDPGRALAPVFTRLEQLGIEPLGPAAGSQSAATPLSVEGIRRKAEEIRQSWRGSGDPEQVT